LFNLYCYINSLTTLDVSTCTALFDLDCSYNALTTLDVSTCTALVTLYCYSNSLTTLDVTGCTALVTLYCEYNSMINTQVDNVLCDVDVNGSLGGTLTITYNAPPTVAGLACAANLIGKGWAVNHD
jgi:Leucine-rich repeat (LRR) protein